MPVVINTFEVVVDDQSQSNSSTPAAPEPSVQPARGATPHEVANILRREQERLARVLAY